jgi:hypothetical protein
MNEENCTNPTEQSILNRPSTDKFLLVLNMPEVLRHKIFENNKLNLTPLQISVYGSVVPTIQVPAIQVPFGGQTYNVSSHTRPNYQPLTVNFVVDNTFYNYWYLWKWLSILNTPRESNYAGNSRSIKGKDDLVEYQTNVSVFGLNEYNKPAIEFIYYYSFITNLGGINYNYRENNMMESTFELQYSQFDVKLLTNTT